ncbi:MAG: histidine phosphatase family protein [Candidatus Saccharimonas sp.]
MKLLLLRHGESEANAAELLSSKPSDPYGLTGKGIKQVKDATHKLHGHIDCIYISPLKRTLQTADIVATTLGDAPRTIIDDRIREIDYGIYSGHPNNPELDVVRKAQVEGDYHVRFGVNGENKYDIELRLYDMLIELLETYTNDQTVLLISHGSITGWLERIIFAVSRDRKEHKAVQNGDMRKYELSTMYIPALDKLRSELRKHGN